MMGSFGRLLFYFFSRSGWRGADLEEFSKEVEGWLPIPAEVVHPPLGGDRLADVVRRKGATAGSLDGWGWREIKLLLVPWSDGLDKILTKVEEDGVWPEGCWTPVLP